MKKIAIIAFTEKGNQLAMRMDQLLPELEVHRYTTQKAACSKNPESRPRWEFSPQPLQTELQDWCGSMFSAMDGLIFIGAAGIAVRTIAPFVHSKVSDPAVLVSDELGLHLISLLSGHLGGGNELTRKLAALMGADPVITTASDVNGKLAVDVWAKKNDLYISGMKRVKEAAAAIVAGKQLFFFCEGKIQGQVPEEFCLQEWKAGEKGQQEFQKSASVLVRMSATGAKDEKQKNLPGILVSPYQRDFFGLHLIPRCVILGIGCKKDKDYETIRRQLEKVCRQYGLSIHSIGKMVSVDRKAQEPGLLQLAETLDIPFETYSAEVLNSLPGTFTGSAFVKETVGVDNVCERTAVMGLPAAEREEPCFVCRKFAEQGVTIALTMKKWEVRFE